MCGMHDEAGSHHFLWSPSYSALFTVAALNRSYLLGHFLAIARWLTQTQ